MKKLAEILKSAGTMVLALVILVVSLIFARECNRDKCPPQGKILVSEQFIDSLEIIAQMLPDTVRDTIYTKGNVIYLPGEKVPVPTPVTPQINFYSDSIVNDSISVWVDITVEGIIKEWDWRYKPVFTELQTTITKPQPQPVRYEVKVKDERTEVYAGIGLGGNQDAFVLSGELNLITKQDHLYGLQYMRFNESNFYLFKVGTKISLSR